MLYGSLDGSGALGRMDTCVYTAESLQHSPEPITTLFINQLNLNRNKKLKKKNKEQLEHIEDKAKILV